MSIFNITKKRVICRKMQIADTFFTRLKGLLGRSGLREGEGLLITPCQSVHTFGMRFPIDVLFLTKTGEVVGLVKELRPRRVSSIYQEAEMTLEIAAGKIKELGIEIGDQLEMEYSNLEE